MNCWTPTLEVTPWHVPRLNRFLDTPNAAQSFVLEA